MGGAAAGMAAPYAQAGKDLGTGLANYYSTPQQQPTGNTTYYGNAGTYATPPMPSGMTGGDMPF